MTLNAYCSKPVSLVATMEILVFCLYVMGILTSQSAIILGVSVSFTWFHIWLALKMCFAPLEFRGVTVAGLSFGWEGIVPSKASRMANKSCDLMIDKLIIVDDIIDSIKGPELYRFLKSLGFVSTINHEIFDSLSAEYFPNLYMPDLFKRQIFSSIEDASYITTVSFISALNSRLKDRSFFDIRDLIVSKFVSDKRLLVNLFTTTGRSELRFIEVSGAIMGLCCGIAQILILYVSPNLVRDYNPYLVFATVNFLIGYLTNWLALYVIFNPIDPVRITRSFELHGLFLRRQPQAAKVYAKIVTDSVLNLDQVLFFLKSNPKKWLEIQSVFAETVRETTYNCLPRTPLLSHSRRSNLVDIIAKTVEEKISNHPEIFSSVVQFIDLKLNLYYLISRNLISLPPRDFEQMLHPVFQEDEFLLIIIGGILGALVGVLQVVLFHL